jgi:predicted RNA-binding protein YlxR (DUF448 family)
MTRASHDQPIRTCVGCGESSARTGMIRLRADSGGELRVVSGRAVAGRTAYLHAREECVRAIARSKRLFRSLRKQIEPRERERFVELALDALTLERSRMRGHTVG